MIIGIGGWERSLKTGLAAILASNLNLFYDLSGKHYNIKQGFGNLSLFDTPYPWTKVTSANLVDIIRKANSNHVRNTLFLIDEADQVYNPRDYTNKQQTENLKGIGQHDKMNNIYLYTYQLGTPNDLLLGVDKILRSNTRIEFEMRAYSTEHDAALYKLTNRLFYGSEPTEGIIKNVSKYFHLWDHLEPVI